MHERHAVTRTRMKEPPTSLLICDGLWPVLLFFGAAFFPWFQGRSSEFVSAFCPGSFFVQHVAMVGRESLDRAVGNGHRGTDCSQRKKSVAYAHRVLRIG